MKQLLKYYGWVVNSEVTLTPPSATHAQTTIFWENACKYPFWVSKTLARRYASFYELIYVQNVHSLNAYWNLNQVKLWHV